ERVEWSEPVDTTLEAGLVQGGISQDLKWQADQLPKTKALYRSLTDEHWDADLLVWPEAAIPALANRELDYFNDLFASARRSDTALLIGAIQSKGPRGDRRYFNSVFGIDANGASEYHKRHLVPFGEYYPVPNFVRRWLADLNLPYTDFTKGPADQEPLTVAGQPVGVSICYEDVFGSELLAMVPRARLLVNVSNDAWFGGSVAPHQHLQIARMRAIEVARPMIRATNSGISAFIEHDGRVSAVTGLFEARVLRAEVQPRTGATPYALAGDWPVLVLALLMGLGAWFGGRRAPA
ncbi:MAG: apolipoprotein N-acyltransferase, partial [Pseudomonadota bacterium]